MQITLNGEPFEIAQPLSVVALLEQLDIDARRVAVEHNLTIIKRQRFSDVIVNDGDQVEIVSGLTAGERIVVDGVATLTDGARVRER